MSKVPRHKVTPNHLDGGGTAGSGYTTGYLSVVKLKAKGSLVSSRESSSLGEVSDSEIRVCKLID